MSLFFLKTSVFICVFLHFSRLPLQGYILNHSTDCSKGACGNQGMGFGGINFILYFFFILEIPSIPLCTYYWLHLNIEKGKDFFFFSFKDLLFSSQRSLKRRWGKAARWWSVACYLWGRQRFWSSSFMGIILLVRFFFSSFSVGSGNWLVSLVGYADLEMGEVSSKGTRKVVEVDRDWRGM